ncbi:glutathione S-transferase [Auriculariales sp. MPI-PUGE-AT-0066]|nr:glutathione S-transferase [Auriculariales sp. MPI-PUGE-AT-0066]
MPDVQIRTPYATGKAADTVAAHKADQDLVFYAGWFCPYVQRAWIALEEKGVPYKYVEINPYDKAPELLALNPRGLVPTVRAHGKPIYESLILNELFEDLYPDAPKLLPTDPVEKARARIWIDALSKIPTADYALVVARTPEEQEKRRQEYYDALRKIAEERAPQGPFFLGEKFSLVDATIAPWVVRDAVLQQHRGWDRKGAGEKWAAWADAIAARPSVLNTSSTKEEYNKLYSSFLNPPATA